MQLKFKFLSIGLSLIAYMNAPAQDSLNISRLGSDYRWGNTYSLTINEGYAYTAGRIIDVRNPENPIYKGRFEGMGSPLDVSISEGLAWFANDGGGVSVYNVEDPASPEIITTFHVEGHIGNSVTAITVRNDIAYIGVIGDLVTYDVSDPANPRYLGIVRQIGFFPKIIIEENIAFVFGTSGLVTLDISDPENPVLLDREIVRGNFIPDAAYLEPFLYFLNNLDSLRIYDTSDPSDLQLVGLIPLNSRALSIAAQGTTLYTGNGLGVCVYDISTPDLPDSITFVKGLYRGYNLAIDNEIIWSARKGLTGFDISEPQAPRRLSQYGFSDGPLSLIPNGDDAIVIGDSGLVFMEDIRDPANPRVNSLFGHYLTSQNGLKLIDSPFGNPLLWSAPSPRGTAKLSLYHTEEDTLIPYWQLEEDVFGPIYGGAINYDLGLLSVVRGDSGIAFYRVDSTALESVEYITNFRFDFDIWDVAMKDTLLAFVSPPSHNGIIQVGYASISDIDQIQFGGRVLLPPTRGNDIRLEFADSRLFIITSGYLYFIDLADPDDPVLIRPDVFPGGINDVCYANDHYFVAAESSIYTLDWSEPENPAITGYYSFNQEVFSSEAKSVSFQEDLLYCAVGSCITVLDPTDALNIRDLPQPLLPGEIHFSAYPNPFNDRATIKINLPTNAPMQLVLFDVTGRRYQAWTLPGKLNGNPNQLNLDGNGLPTGAFYLRASSGERYETLPMMHLK